MAEQLGKIEKPAAESFTNKRKLYLVPLIFCGKDAPAEYVEKFNRYWEQVSQQLANLELKIGTVRHIYHETIAAAGDDGLKLVEKMNSLCHQLIKEKCQSGATLEATEDKELTEESIDWERCLFIGLISRKAIKMVSELYVDTMKKRYEYIAQRINETLKENEAGLLFIHEGHMVQFPQDMEVFSVSPPALDEIRRWQRDREAKSEGEGD